MAADAYARHVVEQRRVPDGMLAAILPHCGWARGPAVPRQLYLPVGVNQFCRFTSSAWPRCWAALVR